MTKIALLLGTSRVNSYSQKVADLVCNELKNNAFDVTCVQPSEYLKSPATARVDDEIPKNEWSNVMEDSSGLVIVTPEYNHGYPGELKLMLDQLYNEYLGKPVLICGVSDGELGGARMVENLLPVLVTLGLYPLRRGVYFSKIDKKFDEKGNFIDEETKASLIKSIGKFKEYLEMLKKT